MITRTKNIQQFDVVGGIVRYLATPEQIRGGDYCIMEGTLPAAVIVPLHSHPDPEIFYLLEGEMELYLDDGTTSGWQAVRSGELAVVSGSAKHAWRNNGQIACRALIVAGPNVYGFFRDIERPVDDAHPPQAPDPNIMAGSSKRLSRTKCWLATPQENESIGLQLPPQPLAMAVRAAGMYRG